MQAAASDNGQLSCRVEDYTLLRDLDYRGEAEGGWFKVWHAKCLVSGKAREFVIKVFDLDKNADIFDDVQKELAVMRGCSHKNIVELHTSFVHNEELWMVLDYMDRGSCGDQLRLKFKTGFPQIAVVYILGQALEAIAYLHREELIHRDIKADNLLIDRSFHVKVTDFWISSVGGGDVRNKAMTYVGTPCWMAPEVIEQESGYDSKADMWSFGITLLELANGRTPFEGQKPLKVLKSILRLPSPRLEGDFSPDLKTVVDRCLKKDPTERPPACDLLEHAPFSIRRPIPQDCTLTDLASTPYRQVQASPKDAWKSVEWTFDDVASLDSMSDVQLDRNISELASDSGSSTAEGARRVDTPAAAVVGATLAKMGGTNGVASDVTNNAQQGMAQITNQNGGRDAPTELAARKNVVEKQPAREESATGLNGHIPPQQAAPIRDEHGPDLSAFNGLLHVKESSLGEALVEEDDDELFGDELGMPAVHDHAEGKTNGEGHGRNGYGKAGSSGHRREPVERTVSFDDVVQVLDGVSDNASKSGVESEAFQNVDANGAEHGGMPIPGALSTLTKNSSFDSILSDGGRSPAPISQSPDGQDVWSELEKMLNEPNSPRSPRAHSPLHGSPCPARPSLDRDRTSPPVPRQGFLQRISSPIPARASPVDDPSAHRRGAEVDATDSLPRRPHAPPHIQTSPSGRSTADADSTAATSSPFGAVRGSMDLQGRPSTDARRTAGSSSGSVGTGRPGLSPVQVTQQGHGVLSISSPSARPNGAGAGVEGAQPPPGKKKFLITDASEKHKDGSSHSLSSGTQSPGGGNPAETFQFAGHRSSLDIRRTQTAGGVDVAQEGGGGGGAGRALPVQSRPESLLGGSEAGSVGHGELLEGVGQTDSVPPLKGSQSLKELQSVAHGTMLPHTSGAKQRFQIKDVPSPDSSLAEHRAVHTSASATELSRQAEHASSNGFHDRASLDMSALSRPPGSKLSPSMTHQPAGVRPPPVVSEQTSQMDARRSSNCERIHEDEEEDVETMDITSLRTLVRRLLHEMKQLRGEKDTLEREKAELRTELLSRPPLAGSSQDGAGTAEDLGVAVGEIPPQ